MKAKRKKRRSISLKEILEKEKRLKRRKALITGPDILVEEWEPPPEPEEDFELDIPNDDEIETPDFGPFDLEGCFPVLPEITVDLDTRKVELNTPPRDFVVGSQALLEAAERIRQALQEKLKAWPGEVEKLLEQQDRWLSRPKDVREHIWRFLRENLTIGFYRGGEARRTVLLGDIALKGRGRPKESRKYALIRQALKGYPLDSYPGKGAWAREVWEKEPGARELWNSPESLRKFLERFLQEGRRDL